MEIRNTRIEEIEAVLAVYDRAREFMQSTGNGNQWVDGYPSKDLIVQDITTGNSYVCVDPEGEIVGVFFFKEGNDPTYDRIYEGAWLNHDPYGVVHRIAGTGRVKGIASACLQWCYDQCGNIRVDTHENNQVMQRVLEKNGFTKCGIIYVANGTARVAFQKCSLRNEKRG